MYRKDMLENQLQDATMKPSELRVVTDKYG